MADISPDRRNHGRNRMIQRYKREMQTLWRGLESDWDSTYAVNVPGSSGERWSKVKDLWSSRYGSLDKAEGINTESGTLKTYDDDRSHTYAAQRSGYGARLTNDAINAIEQMSDEEFDAWAYDANGNWKGTDGAVDHPVFGANVVFEKLKAHLKDTRGHTGEDRVANTLAASNENNMLTGNLLDRSAEEDEKATQPDPPPKDKTKDLISRAGIAYDTIEYREQCFLLTQVFNIVEHRLDVLAEEEHKDLPYIDEGITYGEGEKQTAKTPANASILVDALSPYAFINRLTQYPEQQSFLNLSTPDLSQLQPQIRLFRVTEKTNERTGKLMEDSTEMIFDTATTRQDLEEFMKPTGKRGFGAGIKSFVVNYEASNPFALKKSISAELTIFANTFDELTRDRGGYSYVDLALKTGGYSTVEKMAQEHVPSGDCTTPASIRRYNLNKLNFRLKAVVGWSKPPGVAGLSHANVADVLNTSFITINLTPTIHTFDFDEMGRVTFKIQYLAYIDDFFDEPSYSIFSDYTIVQRQMEREQTYKRLQKVCDTENLAKFKEQMKADVQKDLAQQRSAMWRDLKASGKLRFINLKYSTLRKFQEEGAYFNLAKAESEALDINNLRDAEAGMRNALEKAIKEYSKNPTAKGTGHKDKKNANSTHQVSLVFFYVSDLIDIILRGIDEDFEKKLEYWGELAQEGIAEAMQASRDHTAALFTHGVGSKEHRLSHQAFEKAIEYADSMESTRQNAMLEGTKTIRLYENFKRYRVLLGPVEILDPANPARSACVNLGDLPISFKYFMEWLTGRTLAKDRPYYTIAAFLNDFFNGLIKGFLNDGHCFPRGRGQSKQKTTLNQAAITAYNNRPNAPDTISEMLHNYRIAMQENVSYDVSRLHLYYHDDASDATGWRPIQEWPILKMSGPPGSPVVQRNLDYEVNYVCYYAGRNAPNEQMTGDLFKDMSRGVMHYMAGKDTGIVKNIKFQKTEAPGLKEVRFEQEGYDGLAQLREVYNVTIDTYANVCAFPGSYIFVNPLGLAPNMTFNANVDPSKVSARDLSTYGIGGYYMIIRSSHKFGPGEANTTIDAVWVAEIADDKCKPKAPKKLSEKEKASKCLLLGKPTIQPPKKDKEPKDTVNKRTS